MAVERTFSILKPDATERSLTGAINALIEKAGLRIVAQKRVRISREQAERFYAVHRERPFFRELVEFMISGPVVVQVLEGEKAITRYREVMGAPILQRPLTARSAKFTPDQSEKTPFTAPTRLTLRRGKLRNSFRTTKSSDRGSA